MGIVSRISNLFKKNETRTEAILSEPITVYDDFGRELKITKKDWLDSIFLPALEKNWNNPDALYSDIVWGLRDGFFETVLKLLRPTNSDPLTGF